MRKHRDIVLFIFLFMIAMTSFVSAQETCGQKYILMAKERVTIMSKQSYKQVMARVDTGATYSSIDVSLAKKLKINQPIVGRVKVVNAHGVSWRKIIKVQFMIRNQKRTTYFTLADRSKLEFPVLIGRTSLKGFLVNPIDNSDE